MKIFIFIVLILFSYLLKAETKFEEIIVDTEEFKKVENYDILSSETVIRDSTTNVVNLKIVFIDYSDTKRKVYYANLNQDEFWNFQEFRTLPYSLKNFSVMTVPFKVRSNSEGNITANSNVQNIGVYIPIALRDTKRIWIDNSKSSHKYSFGFLIAPMAQELTDGNTNSYFNDKDKTVSSFMISTSLAFTYTYNSITFALIPIGFDFGIDDLGVKWESHGKYWAGFGIGIDTKLFGY